MSDAAFDRVQIISLVVRLSLVTAATYYSIKWLIGQMDPTNKNKKKAKAIAEEQIRRYLLQDYYIYSKIIKCAFFKVNC